MDNYIFPHSDCSVCQEICKKGDHVCTIRRCSHTFHKACLDPWLTSHTTCPNCRIQIYATEPDPPAAPYDYFADSNCCRLVMKFAFIQLLLNWFTADHYERVKLKFKAAAANIMIRGVRMPHTEVPFESREQMEQTYASLVPLVQCELNNRTVHPQTLLPVHQMIKSLRHIPDIARLCSTL